MKDWFDIMSVLTVISARGGSKRVPRKNVLPLAGKPMIAWTIESALKAENLDRVIVSTDDEEISEVSRQFGAEVPFLRPAELASDSATSVEVVLHAVDWLLRNEEPLPSLILLLQPTSPLRTADDINVSVALQKQKNANAVVSVCEGGHSSSFFRRINSNGELLSVSVDDPSERMFQLNGAIYLVSTAVFMKEKTFTPGNCFAYVMPQERSLDVDTPWDFHVAGLVLKDKYVTGPA
ncbi:MAG: acylneuraminate cytidylyltransferase family protein [Anaerolineales bacterium]